MGELVHGKELISVQFPEHLFFLLPHLSFEPWKFRAGRTRVRCLPRVNFPCRGGTSKALQAVGADALAEDAEVLEGPWEQTVDCLHVYHLCSFGSLGLVF